MYLLPLTIPVQREGEEPSVNDLSTRLGRAYERLSAFMESENCKQSRAAWDARVDIYKNTDYFRRYDTPDLRKLELEAKKRQEDIEDIIRALHQELHEARLEATGSAPPLRFKCKKTLEQWDRELGTVF